jgi:GNAT superfamily N-acetyltransferase
MPRVVRERGLGKRLIERIEAWLIGRGVAVYHVKTIDNRENRALSFYDRAGFSRLGTLQEGDRVFAAFRKTLRGGPDGD